MMIEPTFTSRKLRVEPLHGCVRLAQTNHHKSSRGVIPVLCDIAKRISKRRMVDEKASSFWCLCFTEFEMHMSNAHPNPTAIQQLCNNNAQLVQRPLSLVQDWGRPRFGEGARRHVDILFVGFSQVQSWFSQRFGRRQTFTLLLRCCT